MATIEERVITLEEMMILIAEEHRKVAQTCDKLAQTCDKLAEENRKFSVELQQFKEENRIGFAKLRTGLDELRTGIDELREIQKKNEEANRIGFEKLRKSQQKTDNFFNTQWGKLVEALVKNQVVPLFRDRNIFVDRLARETEGSIDGHNYEFDIIAESHDSSVVVVIEVKTTLRVNDVKHFLGKLDKFKTWFPKYSSSKMYGAVAFLHKASEAPVYAEKHGLFTILATSSSAAITNPSDFQPREF